MNMFISSNKIYFNNVRVKDLRVTAASNINFINIPFDSKDSFSEYMNQFGYEKISSNTLYKVFENYEVNINLSDDNVESIICYSNNDPVSIPEDLLETVMENINSYK